MLFFIFLVGCNNGLQTKNIYHSKWVSSEGYILLITDSTKNNTIVKESCSVYMGEDSLGKCIVNFNKDNGTLIVIWSWCKVACGNPKNFNTISNDTKEFDLLDMIVI